jgi:hypothetical protein
MKRLTNTDANINADKLQKLSAAKKQTACIHVNQDMITIRLLFF